MCQQWKKSVPRRRTRGRRGAGREGEGREQRQTARVLAPGNQLADVLVKARAVGIMEASRPAWGRPRGSKLLVRAAVEAAARGRAH